MRDLSKVAAKRLANEFEAAPGLWVRYDAVLIVPSPIDGVEMVVICSTAHGWDHVSVSRHSKRLPNWIEMDYVKRLLFEDHEVVMQLHVPPKDHINIAEVLHLWRPQKDEIPLPPKELV